MLGRRWSPSKIWFATNLPLLLYCDTFTLILHLGIIWLLVKYLSKHTEKMVQSFSFRIKKNCVICSLLLNSYIVNRCYFSLESFSLPKILEFCTVNLEMVEWGSIWFEMKGYIDESPHLRPLAPFISNILVELVLIISRCPTQCVETLYFYFEIISNYSLCPYNTHLMFNYNIHIIKRRKIKRTKIIMNIHN